MTVHYVLYGSGHQVFHNILSPVPYYIWLTTYSGDSILGTVLFFMLHWRLFSVHSVDVWKYLSMLALATKALPVQLEWFPACLNSFTGHKKWQNGWTSCINCTLGKKLLCRLDAVALIYPLVLFMHLFLSKVTGQIQASSRWNPENHHGHFASLYLSVCKSGVFQHYFPWRIHFCLCWVSRCEKGDIEIPVLE